MHDTCGQYLLYCIQITIQNLHKFSKTLHTKLRTLTCFTSHPKEELTFLNCQDWDSILDPRRVSHALQSSHQVTCRNLSKDSFRYVWGLLSELLIASRISAGIPPGISQNIPTGIDGIPPISGWDCTPEILLQFLQEFLLGFFKIPLLKLIREFLLVLSWLLLGIPLGFTPGSSETPTGVLPGQENAGENPVDVPYVIPPQVASRIAQGILPEALSRKCCWNF